jgi:DNA-binding transcriptional ArsR family regulator/uncharacterized protein YndB with AHSA1/START domain
MQADHTPACYAGSRVLPDSSQYVILWLHMDARYRLVWEGLADPVRREIVDRLSREPATTGRLAAHFPISRVAVMKHLGVLRDCGLVVSRKRGRERWNYLNPVPLQEAFDTWVTPLQQRWARQLLRFKDAMEVASMEGAKTGQHAVGTDRIELEVEIAATVGRVWQALLSEVSAWWPHDFHAVTDAEEITLEPWVGGRLYETGQGGSSVLWYTVTGIDPERALDLAGHLAVRYGGPATSILRLTLEARGSGTVLQVSDAIFGQVTESLRTSLTQGWSYLFTDGLKAYLEKGPDRGPST